MKSELKKQMSDILSHSILIKLKENNLVLLSHIFVADWHSVPLAYLCGLLMAFHHHCILHASFHNSNSYHYFAP